MPFDILQVRASYYCVAAETSYHSRPIRIFYSIALGHKLAHGKCLCRTGRALCVRAQLGFILRPYCRILSSIECANYFTIRFCRQASKTTKVAGYSLCLYTYLNLLLYLCENYW